MFNLFLKEVSDHLLARQHWTRTDYATTIDVLKGLRDFATDALEVIETEDLERYPDRDNDCRI